MGRQHVLKAYSHHFIVSAQTSMTDNPVAREIVGYLLVRGEVL
ncbi:hypothetical protein [Paenibacillus polymyxa]|nr:hypothetical protein [Paenibacillus polymyxa]